MSKFIKVTTYNGQEVWLNSANIVAIVESKDKPDCMRVYTNAVDNSDAKTYLVPGSPEVLIGMLGEEPALF